MWLPVYTAHTHTLSATMNADTAIQLQPRTESTAVSVALSVAVSVAESMPGSMPGSGAEPTPQEEVEQAEQAEQGEAQALDERVIALVPAYNEERFIGSVVLKARAYADAVLVVDDGSRDQTAQLATEAGAVVISHLTNHGKAAALRTGFDYACRQGYGVIVTLDGDGQHDPAEIPKLVQPILQAAADMVIGSRFLEVKSAIPAWRQVGQHALTTFTNVASGVNCTDSQTGFRAFRSTALRSFNMATEGFAVESEMQFWAHEEHLRVAEVAVGCVYVEPPKRNPVTHAITVIDGILTMLSEARPLFFFGVGGIAVALAGVVWWLWVLNQYAQSGSFSAAGAVIASLLVVWGTIASFEGVVLHMLRKMLQQLGNRLDRQSVRRQAASSSSVITRR